MATAKSPTVEDLSAQIDTLKADIATLTQTLADLGRARGEELSGSLKNGAAQARAGTEAQIAEAQKQLIAGAETAEDYVRRNPGVALGVAAGVGVLVGLLTARR